MTASSPIVSTTRKAIADALRSLFPQAKIHEDRRNARTSIEFEKLFMVGNQTDAWEVEYDPTQPEAVEQDQGDLYLRTHRFIVHHWAGPFHDEDETGVDVVDKLHEAADRLTADPAIFALPEVTSRAVGPVGHVREHFHFALHHHGTLLVQVTAEQFKVS